MPAPRRLPCTGTIIWEDDFNSSDPLSDDYTVSTFTVPTKVAGAGPDGSQVVDFPVTASTPARIQRLGLDAAGLAYEYCVSLDMRLAAATETTSSRWNIFHDRTPNFGVIEVNSDSTNKIHVFIDRTPTQNYHSADDVHPVATWFNLRMEVKISTFDGTDHLADGYVRVYVDDVLVLDTGLQIIARTSATQTEIDEIDITGEGLRIDNLVIRNFQ